MRMSIGAERQDTLAWSVERTPPPAAGVRSRELRWQTVRMIIAWVAIGLILSALAVALVWFSDLYGYDFQVIEMPIQPLVIGLFLAGLTFCALAWLVHASVIDGSLPTKPLVIFVLLVGLGMRLVMFWSEPVMEDDYQRYMWDGAVTAQGINPYTVQPDLARQAELGPDITALAQDSGVVVDRINHPNLRTIYPPVAQGLFAVGHFIKPFQLSGWRTVCLIGDLITVSLILYLLVRVGRSPLWVALYWWNPVVIKEFFNSAHMEATLLPFILGGLVLAMHKRIYMATMAIIAAIGIKLWPGYLLPLVWRNSAGSDRQLTVAIGLTGLAGLLMALPILISGLDETSGFVAYASRWQTNSALFPALQSLVTASFALLEISQVKPGLVVRLFLAGLVAITALAVALNPAKNDKDLIDRAALVVVTMVLLSPAQFPWYVCWLAPFLCFRPLWGLIALMMTVSLYYYSFHLRPIGEYEFFKDVVVWVIWVPVWALLVAETIWRSRAPLENSDLRLA